MVEHSSTPILSVRTVTPEWIATACCCLERDMGLLPLDTPKNTRTHAHAISTKTVFCQAAHSSVVQGSQEVPPLLTTESGCQSIMGSSTRNEGTQQRAVPSREAAGSKAGKECSRSKIQLTPTNQRKASAPLPAVHMLVRQD